jgi:hypothetical protein
VEANFTKPGNAMSAPADDDGLIWIIKVKIYWQ